MKQDLLKILGCPMCRGELTLLHGCDRGSEITGGELGCLACSRIYPVVASIPRFVQAENYAANFGFQWNRFRQTQLDSHTGLPISRERFFLSTQWKPEELAGKRVLDVGCGAGRFAEVALSAGADVVAVDYSSAADACWQNLGPHQRLNVIQGDIYHLPFKLESFDYIYCFGVLQHTPDVRKAFLALPPYLKPGGKIAVDVYAKVALNALWPKYWLRPITKRMNPRRLFGMVQRAVPLLLPVSDSLAKIPVIGRRLRYAVPVANHRPDFPSLTDQQQVEWAVLNTYDMFSPAHDQPQSAKVLRRWFLEAGLDQVEVYRKGHLIGHAVRS